MIPHHIPIVFHNISSYNMHLFIRKLGKKFDSRYIGMIAKNQEKYISFDYKVVVDEYEAPLGETKQIKRQL